MLQHYEAFNHQDILAVAYALKESAFCAAELQLRKTASQTPFEAFSQEDFIGLLGLQGSPLLQVDDNKHCSNIERECIAGCMHLVMCSLSALANN